MKMDITAPWMDQIIEQCENNSLITDPFKKKLLADIYLSMSRILAEGDDEIRELWIDIPRGSIYDFGDFEEYLSEGLVDSYEAFKQEWEDYYPDKVKWYSITTARYRDDQFFLYQFKTVLYH
ncbi:MAG: hypothetical protein AMS23_04715 [Bacteroides sp. SM1_62]|nr:MAG: hypothetical protein AMS26_06215 [Bacteroides sp. SM23_62]KPL25702.1 MAG: hypothetical protein AMS23_04715 [Bacteroides sp. SM1_62]